MDMRGKWEEKQRMGEELLKVVRSVSRGFVQTALIFAALES